MCEHHAFGHSGGARRVNERGQRIRRNGHGVVVVRGVVHLHRLSELRQLFERHCRLFPVVLERHDVTQVRQVLLDLCHFLELPGVFHEDGDGAGVFQDVLDFVGCEAGIDGHVRAADRQAPKIRYGPLGSVGRQDGDSVSRIDAQLAEAEAYLLDLARQFLMRDVLPFPIHFVAERCAFRREAVDGEEEELWERLRGRHAVLRGRWRVDRTV